MCNALILIPFFSIVILNLPFGTALKKAAFWVALGLSIAQICFAALAAADTWGRTFGVFGTLLKFDLAVDGLSRVMLLCIGTVLFTALLVGRYLIRDIDRRFNFTNLLLVAMAGMNGLVIVQDIFSLYVYIEITAVASFILIAFEKDMPALEGAFKYIILSAVASTLMLSAIALLLLISQSTGFSAIQAALKASHHSFLIIFAVGIFACGLFIKAGLMPFHGWLPDTYSAAPAAVSVLLAGVVTKAVGVYTLMRLVISVFNFDSPLQHVLLAIGTLSVVLGAIAALGQNDFKRMLAYSSISQVGYIVLGLGCGTALGLSGAVFHLFNHAIFKSLLFTNAAAIETEAQTRDLRKITGLGVRMPVTGITSLLGSLSTAGIPPLAGFWSKLMIIMALWMSGNRLFAMIAVAASVVTLAYFLTLQRNVFFRKPNSEMGSVKEAGFGLVLPAVILALVTIGVGLLFPLVLNNLIFPAGKILGG